MMKFPCLTQRLFPALPRSPLALAAIALVFGASGAASAQESPYYLGVTQNFTRDSNIGRSAKGTEIADTISSTGLRAGVDQPIGRQRINLGGEVATNRYASNSQLNNTSYTLNGRLDWATIENISGSVALGSRQALNSLNLTAAQAASLPRNLQRISNYAFEIQKGNVTLFTVDAGLSGDRVSNSSTLLEAGNFSSNTLNIGVRVQPSPILSARLGARHTSADYAITGDKVRRNDIDLSGDYELSGLSRLNSRISYTNEDHSLTGGRGVKGLTGALGWSWKPTGKLSFDTHLARDTSLGSYNLISNPTPTTLATNRLTSDAQIRDSLTLQTSWEVSAFINVSATLGYARRTLDSTYDVAAVGAKDQTTSLSLGMTYTPLRNLVLGCGLNRENRTVDGVVATTATFAYADTSINCYGQAYLR